LREEKMPIYLNITKARNHLLKNKVIYTLREKRRKYLGKSQIRKGSFRIFEEISMGRVSYVKTIDNDNELLPYVNQSGFKEVEDWREKAGKGKYLYKVELI